MQMKMRLALTLAILNACACGNRESRLLDKVDVKGIAPLGGDLAYVQSSGVVQRLNVMGVNPQPKTTKISITSNPRIVIRRPGVEELLVVSDGRSDQYGQVIEPPALTVLPDQNSKREYPLVDPGQQMKLSDDGKFAVLFNDPSYVDTTSLLTNPGQVAIIGLDKDKYPPTDIIHSLDTVGGPPFAVWFLTLNVGTQVGRPFALFAFPQGISLVDLDSPDDKEPKLDLTRWLPSGGMDKTSGFGVAFDQGSAEIYLKNSHSSDIKVLSVAPGIPTTDGGSGNTVNISVRSLTVSNSTAPGAFDVYSLASGSRLLATVGNSVASVTTDSDTVTSVALSTPANQILRFDAKAPKDPNSGQRALLYQTDPTGGSLQSSVTFVNLEDLEIGKAAALETVDFGAKISSVVQLPNLPLQLLVILSGGGIDVLDLEKRHWSPIDSKVPITLTAATSNRLWVGSAGDNRIGYVDLSNSDPTDPTSAVMLTIKSTQLDSPVQQMFQMNQSSNSRVIVTHDQVGGAVTWVDANNPERSAAHKLEGFLLSDLL